MLVEKHLMFKVAINNNAQWIVLCLLGHLGALVMLRAMEVNKPDQEMLSYLPKKVETLVEQHQKFNHVTNNHAQLTVLCLNGLHGPLVMLHAMEEDNQGTEAQWSQLNLEEDHVVQPTRFKLAINNNAQ